MLSPAVLTENWALKLAAVVLAVLLWAAVRSETSVRYVTTVPVSIESNEVGWVRTAPPAPQEITVEFFGPVRELIRLAFNEPELVVPIDDVTDSIQSHRIQQEWLELGGPFENLRVDAISPASIRAFHQPLETRMMPVAIRLGRSLPSGLVLDGAPLTQPERVQVQGPRNRVLSLDSVYAEIAELPRAPGIGTTTTTAVIDTTDLGVEVSPLEIEVTLPLVRRQPADTLGTTSAPGGGGPRPRWP